MSRAANDYYETMRARYAALSGCAPDPASDFCLRFRALAEELAGLDARLEEAERQSFGPTASGGALDGHAGARGLLRRPAVPAEGTLVFTRGRTDAALTLPEGTECADDDGTRYRTTGAAAFAEGAAAASAPARAARPGRAGNAAAGTVRRLLRPVEDLAVKNPAPFTGGCDEEDDRSLRERLLKSYAEPSNGANAAFYRQAAENRPGVSHAAVEAAGGTVTVHLAADGRDAVPEAVVAALEAELNARREPCAVVRVQSAQAVPVDLRLAVEPAEGVSLAKAEAALTPALRAEAERLPIGGRLTRARLVQLAMESGLLQNCRVDSPATDRAAGPFQVLRPGSVEVTGWGAAG